MLVPRVVFKRLEPWQLSRLRLCVPLISQFGQWAEAGAVSRSSRHEMAAGESRHGWKARQN